MNEKLTAFIPHRLAIPGRPGLYVFPFNVLFAALTVIDGKSVGASAVYEPDLESFRQDLDGQYVLEYRNRWSAACRVVIEYDPATGWYRSTKYVRGQSVGLAAGKEWDNFFLHFTALGLAEGEGCKFS